MDELGLIAGAVEHEDGADGGPFDHREGEVAIDRKGLEDPQDDHRLAAEIPFVKRDRGRYRGFTDACAGLFPDEPAGVVATFPGPQLAPMALRGGAAGCRQNSG
ncbi:hypothetical protein [Aliihoeflea sp. 40Bstr573]|uniref:hypothetical protein n=1 Tax=Aliihoeflea sp. 40Bstr573 TaxID=2696467 RepID=UPI003383BCD3|nr:hypothetical protein [Aliihoeflea sp. 40Bstr573]